MNDDRESVRYARDLLIDAMLRQHVWETAQAELEYEENEKKRARILQRVIDKFSLDASASDEDAVADAFSASQEHYAYKLGEKLGISEDDASAIYQAAAAVAYTNGREGKPLDKVKVAGALKDYLVANGVMEE